VPRPDPIPALKQQLGATLAPLVTGWYGDDIAYVLKTDRARIGDLRREKLDRFSLETLIRYVTRLGWSVEIRLAPPPSSRARPR
jgi:predicted XRE-type DNA-binding protein